MPTLDELIDQKIGEVRTESLDISFGEIISLYENAELIIQPDYQRLFRWSEDQQSRLVESILLELPIPQIFVIENSDSVLELIDGLQRLSSVIHFIQPVLLQKEPLRLDGCELIPDLNGKVYEDLPLRLRLRLKRSAVRMVVIKRQSTSMLRYEMFKRLNTGGSLLSHQEIRNCTARMIGENGIAFYRCLQECAEMEEFKSCIETLSETDKNQRGDEELVLRFFAVKNARDLFHGSVRDWLDTYMELVILELKPFDYKIEMDSFRGIFAFLSDKIGPGAFVRYKFNSPFGGLAPAYFEAVTMAVLDLMPQIYQISSENLQRAISITVQSSEFRQVTGPGANSRQKLQSRIDITRNIIGGYLNNA